ncbi:type III effector protein RopAA [Pseudomonas congelans]|uniref:type III effector protein RopAA n=1 Tax=Pseudomonas congelans TaxID=200452 RepID=UPI001F3E063F|nr:type III effector protein RopAA [Pseudomonas congelans]MCF5167305.1 type III effector protein RopAA [Pseudomonas congelans]
MEARFQAIQGQLIAIFQNHFTGSNREAFQTLIDDRARRLALDGETAQSVDAVMIKGSRLDRASNSAVGFTRAIPFGAASLALDMVPAITGNGAVKSTLALSAISGLVSTAADTIGNGLMHRATSNTQWLVADDDALDPLMSAAAASVKPDLVTQAAERSLTFQAFTVRNVLRTVVQPVLTQALDKKTASKAGSVYTAIDTPAFGIAAYHWQESIDRAKHRVGPEYLLGREDWHQRFKDLKAYGLNDAVSGLAKRMAKLPLDAMRDSSKSLQALVTPTGLVSGLGALAGGITANNLAQALVTEAAKNAKFSPAAVVALSKATMTAIGIPATIAWTTTAVLTQPVADRISQKIDRLTGTPEYEEEQQGMLPLVDLHPDMRHTDENSSLNGDSNSFYSAQTNLNDTNSVV